MSSLALMLLLAATDAGTTTDGGVARLTILRSVLDNEGPEVTELGSSPLYGAKSITSIKANEDHHWAGCGYTRDFHYLFVTVPDAGWSGFLGYSGSSSCPATEFSDVDRAELTDAGVIRIISGFKKSETHRARKGSVLHLVPYQDFAVPREIGVIKPLPLAKKSCLQPVEQSGVFFEMGGWCFDTRNAITCLALKNRCDFAIDAEGHAFSFAEYDLEVKRGCVIPAGENALIVSEHRSPEALTFWIARCPATYRTVSR